MVTNLVTLGPDDDVLQAMQRLVKHRISGAPVVDRDGQYLGVISERDCLTALLDAVYDRLPSNRVATFVDKSSRTIDEDTDLLTIVQIFLDTRQRRIPVLRGAKLVGQISRRDVLRTVLDSLEVQASRDKSLLYLSALWDRNEAPID
jgi:CBS domain-containing protein